MAMAVTRSPFPIVAHAMALHKMPVVRMVVEEKAGVKIAAAVITALHAAKIAVAMKVAAIVAADKRV